MEPVASQYENCTFKKVLIKYLLEQENWISGSVLGMTSFGPKKKKNSSCSIFPGAQKRTLSPNISLLILFSFSLACILLTHFLIYLLWIAQWVASFLESESLLGDAVLKQKCTQTPRPTAAKKSPFCNPVWWIRSFYSSMPECSGLIKTWAIKECSWQQAGSLQSD